MESSLFTTEIIHDLNAEKNSYEIFFMDKKQK